MEDAEGCVCVGGGGWEQCVCVCVGGGGAVCVCVGWGVGGDGGWGVDTRQTERTNEKYFTADWPRSQDNVRLNRTINLKVEANWNRYKKLFLPCQYISVHYSF